MGSGFSKKKKQAKQFQDQLMQMQEQMAQQMSDLKVEGTAGNGLVTLTLTGDHELTDIKIKPDCVDPEDVEGLEDLIKAAYSDALTKVQEKGQSQSPGLGGIPGGGMPNIPGFPDLSKLGL